MSDATFDALRKRTIGQELTKDELALVCLWMIRMDQDLEKDRFETNLDEWL